MLGMFDVNSVPATVIFDSGASHSFISSTFGRMHSLPLCLLKNPIMVSSPGGGMQATLRCPVIKVILRGVEFKVDPKNWVGSNPTHMVPEPNIC